METKKRCSDCKYWENEVAESPCFDCESHSEWEALFQPEYFSGLNWREAEKLVGRVVEFSKNGDAWLGGPLVRVKDSDCTELRFVGPSGLGYTYIRTCPQTHAHPTITIGGVELPRPEVEAPAKGTRYWLFEPTERPYYLTRHSWDDQEPDLIWLQNHLVHLTESRAQAWADWWENTVMAVVKEAK